jgi:hypothetical protein
MQVDRSGSETGWDFRAASLTHLADILMIG